MESVIVSTLGVALDENASSECSSIEVDGIVKIFTSASAKISDIKGGPHKDEDFSRLDVNRKCHPVLNKEGIRMSRFEYQVSREIAYQIDPQESPRIDIKRLDHTCVVIDAKRVPASKIKLVKAIFMDPLEIFDVFVYTDLKESVDVFLEGLIPKYPKGIRDKSSDFFWWKYEVEKIAFAKSVGKIPNYMRIVESSERKFADTNFRGDLFNALCFRVFSLFHIGLWTNAAVELNKSLYHPLKTINVDHLENLTF
jgi:hypothetical protein